MLNPILVAPSYRNSSVCLNELDIHIHPTAKLSFTYCWKNFTFQTYGYLYYHGTSHLFQN